MTSLEGKVVAIAGAAGGLGPTVCRRLAEAGATIAATDVDESKLDALASELGIPDDRWDGRPANLLTADGATEWASAISERFGKVDALVHLVGGWKGGEPLATASLDDYEWLHDLLVRTLQHASRAFHDTIAHEGGRFVLISSSQAQKPDGTNASYGATKAAAEAWTLALADSLAESGATANILVVNAILTPAMREANPDKPYKTFTSVEDIADGVAFLLSDAAQKMNGARLELHP
ncbi:MAG TPA: SDR family oxidoreductase [Solirubrobacterales bacterium]|nr:SDR family oxidoreductase [Solirubrobacterales bacterium]